MHEYSIVSSLVERVERVAIEHPRAIVRRVHVRIGEQAGVELALLRIAYETFRARTVCSDAELALDIVAGDDMTLMRVELEVPDV